MSRQDLEHCCRTHLAELDRLTTLLGADLASLRAALPLDQSRFECLRAALRCSATLRTTLEEAARQAALSQPVWTDRVSLGTALDALFAAWAEAESSLPRRRLTDLAAVVEQGQLRHKLPSKQARLEAIRLRVPLELRQAAQTTAPTPLPGPGQVGLWLSWAWQQDGETLDRLVQDLRPSFPALAEMLVEGEWDWWQQGCAPGEQASSNGVAANSVASAAPPSGPATTSESSESITPLSTANSADPSAPLAPSSRSLGRPPIRPAVLVRLPAPVRPPPSARVVAPPPLETPAPQVVALEPAPVPSAVPAPRPPTRLTTPVRQPVAHPHNIPTAPRVVVQAPPPPPTSNPLTPPAPLSEPAPEILSFSAFSDRYWIAPSGRCEPVPWLAADFGNALDGAQQDALTRLARGEAEALGPLWICASAAERLGGCPLLPPRTVAAVAALWAEPISPTAGRDRARAVWLRNSLLDGADSPPSKPASPQGLGPLSLFLEAVRPSPEAPLTDAEVDDLFVLMSIRDKALERVIRDLLRLASLTPDPLARLRSALAAAPESLDDCRLELERRREGLYREILRLGRAAGSSYVGRFAHCTQSWAEFFEEIRSQLKTFYPRAHQGAGDWDPDEADVWIASLPALHDRIADDNEALEKSRKIMDRAARTLTDQLAAVNEAQRHLHALRDARLDKGTEAIPAEDARRLLQAEPLAAPDEEVCRLLLIRLLTPPATPTVDPLILTAEQVLARPDLVGQLTDLPGSDSETPIRWDGLADPTRAAAVLLAPLPASPPSADDEEPLDALARWLKRHKRFHLLGRLAGRLPVEEQKLVHRKRDEAVDRMQAALAGLQAVWPQLADLAAPQAASLRPALDEARRLAGEDSDRDIDPDLALAWLEALRSETLRARDSTILALRYVLSSAGDERSLGRLSLLDEGRYGEVFCSTDERRSEGPSSLLERTAVAGGRETRWRHEADKRFANPRGRLLALKDDLAVAWTHALGPAQALRSLRTTFVRWIFGGDAVHSLYRRGEQSSLQPEAFLLPCRALRDHLAAAMPTFLPQLADFTDLVVLTPPVAPSDPTFGTRAADLVSQQGRGALCVVLAPGLTREVRTEILRDFRRRLLTSALFDDLDLCRLLNPGGRQPALVLGLLEILFEQLPWSRVSPFLAGNASFVAGPEMIVGRTDEAEELFRSARYSRLFSGRKLGKTTLLRHLEQTCDGRELPGRLTLHVLLLSIVGVQTESNLVARLFEAVHRRLGFDPALELAEGTTGATLIRYLLRFIEQRPNQSLLFLLDDADEFVRAQLDAFEEVGEDCLAVRLRTQLGSVVDSTQLPRVRFIFSGYRVTATYGGPWAHGGEVLHLKPLRSDVAATLVAAPLARLGIDASSQADAIAFRCGYQPAVLLRFGEELLRHLEARHGYQEGVTVTAEDVNAAFHQRAVQDEIRLGVRNNFWGNPLGQMVYAAMLLELAALPPGQGLRNAADAVLRRLRTFDLELSWLVGDAGSDREQVISQLADLVRRHLLVERPDPEGTVYALPFPYHLSVLLANDPGADIRAALQALRNQAARQQQGDSADGHRGLLSRRAMADLRQALALPDLRAVVVGSHWPRAVGHRTGGLPDRLGIDPNQVRPATVALRPPLIEATQLAALDADAESLTTLLALRPPGLPAPLVIGGADLLRRALDQAHQGEGYEVVGLGRLTRPVLRWWFESVRCLDFAGSDDLDLLVRRTSGIPFLVRLLDELLVRPGTTEGGILIDPQELARALAAFDERLPEEIALLTNGPPAVRLTPREIDVLRMLETVGAALGYPTDLDPARSLGEEWSLLYADVWSDQWPGLPFPEPVTDSVRDQKAVQTVLLLGLAPGEGNHLAPLRADDALTDLLTRLVVSS